MPFLVLLPSFYLQHFGFRMRSVRMTAGSLLTAGGENLIWRISVRINGLLREVDLFLLLFVKAKENTFVKCCRKAERARCTLK